MKILVQGEIITMKLKLKYLVFLYLSRQKK